LKGLFREEDLEVLELVVEVWNSLAVEDTVFFIRNLECQRGQVAQFGLS
jgi:hypothetical protein